METELARTFLTVVAAGNFISAADRLHVTQSTVSARIRTLEEQLACTLFVRNKAGTVLTPAGRQFQKHAASLVRTVEQARQDVGIPMGYRAVLAVGGRIGLWENLLLRWLRLMQETAPDVSLRAEIGFEEDLMQRLIEGRIDIGVMYTPQSRPGLNVELLLEEEARVRFELSQRPNPGRERAMCISTGGRSSMRSTASAFPSSSVPVCWSISAGSGCSTSWRTAAPAIFRSVSSAPIWRTDASTWSGTRRSSGTRPTLCIPPRARAILLQRRSRACAKSPPAKQRQTCKGRSLQPTTLIPAPNERPISKAAVMPHSLTAACCLALELEADGGLRDPHPSPRQVLLEYAV